MSNLNLKIHQKKVRINLQQNQIQFKHNQKKNLIKILKLILNLYLKHYQKKVKINHLLIKV